MQSAHNHKPTAYSEIVTYWRGVRATLAQRNLLKGEQVPEARALVLPDRAIFVLDMNRLAGISREKWLDRDLWLQIRAALQGRRTYVADSAGLALVVAREPGTHELKRLPKLIELTREHLPDGDYTVTLGYDRMGPVVMDLAGAQRAVLMGGRSGGGKTNGMQILLAQLMMKHGPEEVQIAVVDTKQLDFVDWHHLPHLYAPVANTLEEADALISSVEQEMIRRQVVMKQVGIKKWETRPDIFPLLVLLVDEAADFPGTAAMASMVEVARKGRATGISVIVGTQYPTSDVISPQVKANLQTAIAFDCRSGTESRVILDRTGAEALGEPGLALTYIERRWRRVRVLWLEQEIIADLAEQHAAPSPSNPVSELEARLVQYAGEELDGGFVIGRLYERFGEHISKYKLGKLSKTWEGRGWLTAPQHDEEGRPLGRMVTEELAKLAAQRLGPTHDAENRDTVIGRIGRDRS